MPLFLAVTGYFLSLQTLNLPFLAILKKYTYRVIIPFIPAFLIYTYNYGNLADIQSYLYPFYHLWYIPAVLLFVFYTKGVVWLYTKQFFFIIALLICIILGLTVFFEAYGQWKLLNHTIYFWLGDKRFYYFFSYFLFGFYLAKNRVAVNRLMITAILFISLAIYCLSELTLLQGVAKTVANFCIIYLAIRIAEQSANAKANLLAKIGSVSLPIYLWHVLPIQTLQRSAHSLEQYYLFSAGSFTLFILIIIWLNDRNKFLNLLFYGKKS